MTAHTFWRCRTLIFHFPSFFHYLIHWLFTCFCTPSVLFFLLKGNSLGISAEIMKFCGFEFRSMGINEKGSLVINLVINFLQSFQLYFSYSSYLQIPHKWRLLSSSFNAIFCFGSVRTSTLNIVEHNMQNNTGKSPGKPNKEGEWHFSLATSLAHFWNSFANWKLSHQVVR